MQSYFGRVYVRLLGVAFILTALAATALSQNMFRKMNDFDGDGIGDLAIFHPSSGDWWWIRSSDGTARATNWGVNGDTPITGDYDGDGKTDLAIWRVVSDQGYFWIYGSQNGSITVVPWGLSTDALVRGS